MVRLKIQKVLISLVSFIIIIYMILDKEDRNLGITKVPPRYLQRFKRVRSKALQSTSTDRVNILQVKFNSTETIKSNNSSLNRDKWIIVTSVNEPTEQIKKLAAIKEFQLLVVGDTKTNQKWAFGNAIFLSIAEQEALGFRIYPDIPFK